MTLNEVDVIESDEQLVAVLGHPIAALDAEVVFERGRILHHRAVKLPPGQSVPHDRLWALPSQGYEPTEENCRTGVAGDTTFARALRMVRSGRSSPRVAVHVVPITDGPVPSWRATAVAVGVNEDTIHRWKQKGDERLLPFASPDAAREWWRMRRYGAKAAEGGLKPPRAPKRPRVSKASGGPVDWKKKARGDDE